MKAEFHTSDPLPYECLCTPDGATHAASCVAYNAKKRQEALPAHSGAVIRTVPLTVVVEDRHVQQWLASMNIPMGKPIVLFFEPALSKIETDQIEFSKVMAESLRQLDDPNV